MLMGVRLQKHIVRGLSAGIKPKRPRPQCRPQRDQTPALSKSCECMRKLIFQFLEMVRQLAPPGLVSSELATPCGTRSAAIAQYKRCFCTLSNGTPPLAPTGSGHGSPAAARQTSSPAAHPTTTVLHDARSVVAVLHKPYNCSLALPFAWRFGHVVGWSLRALTSTCGAAAGENKEHSAGDERQRVAEACQSPL